MFKNLCRLNIATHLKFRLQPQINLIRHSSISERLFKKKTDNTDLVGSEKYIKIYSFKPVILVSGIISLKRVVPIATLVLLGIAFSQGFNLSYCYIVLLPSKFFL